MSHTIKYNITCCHHCVAPKRYPGCHDHCTDYLEEKAGYEANKAEFDKQRYIKSGLDSQTFASMNRYKKSKGRK